VSAGSDQSITLPANAVSLTGSGADTDGSIASYAWTKVSGPASGVIGSPSQASTQVTGLVQGTYIFQLTVTDNAGATASDDVMITVNPSGTPSQTNFQAYIATTTTGVQNFGGELGMEFRVSNASGIVVNQLGAFDHQGNGITGTQSGGIRVAIFNQATKTIVPGLDAIIIGNADAYSGNHRMKNVPAVTLMPGDYMIVAKGYNANELNGNSGVGTPFAPGDLGNGAISYAATCAYGSTRLGFAYPTNPDGGPGNRYLAGTFRYSRPSGAVTTMVGTAEARERRFALTVPQQPMSLGTYPNPATSSFTLNVNNGYTGSMLVQFVGSNGVVYKTLQLNKTQTGFQPITISTAGLQKGRYVVTVSGGGVRPNNDTNQIVGFQMFSKSCGLSAGLFFVS
jgi:hypothetical protein